MREIKFRAWNGKRMSGSNDYYAVCDDIIVYVKYEPVAGGIWKPTVCKQLTWNECQNITMLQYTGLKDKNGVELYDGDIIQYLDAWDTSTESGFDWDEYTNTGVISWSDREARFTVSNLESIEIDQLIEEIGNCVKIGTIYENPELLEGK